MDEDGTGLPKQGVPGLTPSIHAVTPLDELDRKIVVALQQDGRASWRSIAQLVGVPVSTVVRRGQRLLDQGIVRVAAIPAAGASGPFENFWIRVQCFPGKAKTVADTLSNRTSTRFVAVVTGEYDIVAEIVVRGGMYEQFSTIENLRSIDGVRHVRSDLIAHVYKMSYDWGRQIYEEHFDNVPPLRPSDEVECNPTHFDESDRAILKILGEDGRETFQHIGNQLGLNESSVRRRFDRMLQLNCVNIITFVPSAALGMESEVILQVRVLPARIKAVAAELETKLSVRFMSLLLDDNSLLCEVITPTIDSLHEFLSDQLANLDGVLGWSAAMELVYVKRAFIKTPWPDSYSSSDDY